MAAALKGIKMAGAVGSDMEGKKGKGQVKKQVYKTHGHGQRGWGWNMGGRMGTAGDSNGENGDNYN